MSIQFLLSNDCICATAIWNVENFSSVFKVKDQIYNRGGSLIPILNKRSNLLQIYVVGDEKFKICLRRTHILGLQQVIFGVYNINSTNITSDQFVQEFTKKNACRQII